MNIRYLRPEELIVHELDQVHQEGGNVAEFADQWDAAKAVESNPDKLDKIALRLLDRLAQVKTDSDLALAEPSDLDEIRLKSQAGMLQKSSATLSDDDLLDKILGGWLGRCAGCLLGKPVEKTGRIGLREILQASGQWPLAQYITAQGIPEELRQKYPWNRHGGVQSLRENITCMPEDDDLNYPLINLIAAQRHGAEFTTEHIAQIWLEFLPVLSTFTAERVAYVNCLKLVPIDACATKNNPYREWIGAQIRADLWGWITLGDPLRASEYAWRDARLSHVRNGIYGEMFFAAAIAAAGTCQEIDQILDSALKTVPEQSRFVHAVQFAREIARKSRDWEEILDRLHEEYRDFYWVHTINNAALVVAALEFGAGDFEKTICAAVMGGWDTDCNGATAGSVLGVVLGARALPAKWIAPLHNCLRSSVMGFDYSRLDLLAQETVNVYKTIN